MGLCSSGEGRRRRRSRIQELSVGKANSKGGAESHELRCRTRGAQDRYSHPLSRTASAQRDTSSRNLGIATAPAGSLGAPECEAWFGVVVGFFFFCCSSVVCRWFFVWCG